VIQLSEVSKSFDGILAVDSLDLSIEPGRILGFLGPNGAGKTTTLRMIMNIIQADTGVIHYSGKPQLPPVNQIGYLPEERGLYQKISVIETITYFASLRGVSRAAARGYELLERFELADRAGAKVQELSRGNQQKLQFINTIVHDPEIVIMDEPFSGLDPVNQILLKDILSELKAAGRTIVFSSHQMDQVEKVCDDVAMIDKGRLVLSGKLSNISREYGGQQLEVILEEGQVLGDGLLADLVGEHLDNRYYFPLGSKDDRQSLIEMLNRKASIRSIRIAEAGLEEIFISVVKEGQA